MCHACVTESVKRRMMSRRDLFAAAPAALAAGAGLSAGFAAAPALAQGASSVVDLTHTLSEDFPTFGGTPGVSREKPISFEKDGYNLYVVTINEHTGTHIDAPLHFSADGASVDAMPVESLVCPLCVVDIRAKSASDADAQVTPDDLKAWIGAHGPIPAGACVAMNSGWSGKVNGHGFRNADSARPGTLHFPGFHVEAAKMLMEESGAVAMGVDTLSLDHGPSADFATHYAWLPSGRYGIECMANLDRLPATGATLVVGAPKLRGGTGGPARILALV